MPKHLGKHSYLLIGLLALAMLTLAVLPTWAAPNTTTKILFLRSGTDATSYKAFLSGTVYPGQTMVYDDVANDFNGAIGGTLDAAHKARLLDADLIIVLDTHWNRWGTTGYYDIATWQGLQAPILNHNGWTARHWDLANGRYGWGWIEAYGTKVDSYGPNPGVSVGCLAKPQWLDAGSEPFYTMNGNALGSRLGSAGADAGANPDANFRWIQIFNSAVRLTEGNWSNAGAGAIQLMNMYKGNNGDPLANWMAISPCNIVRWPQGGAMYGTPAAARRFFFDLCGLDSSSVGGYADGSGANAASNFLATDGTADGKLALKNALTLMYDPQYGRRPTIGVSPSPVVITHPAGPTDVMAPIIDVAITNGGTLPEPTIAWTVLPALGYDAAGSTNLNTASPTFHFTADGTYTATVKAQKPGLDYVSATKQIQVIAGNPVTKILFVQGKDSRDLSAYKSFLTTIYPGRTMVFSGDTLADKSAFASPTNGALTPTQLARINDADLVILTPDLTPGNYISPDWALLYVPMMMNSVYLSRDASDGWGWIGGYFESGGAMPSHNPGVADGMAGDQWIGGNQWSTDTFYTGLTGHFTGPNPAGWTINGSAISGDPNANWFPLFNNATYSMAGTINGLSWGTGTMLFSGNGSSPYNTKGFIVRWAQGTNLYRAGTKAASRRFAFNMGASADTDAVNTFLNVTTGANANGLRALQNALTYLYNPVNGRRPTVNAGIDAQLDLGVSSNYIVAPGEASYSNGDGGSAGTVLWTIAAVDPADAGKVTIASGATTLTPTFHFTGTGVFIATLAGIKPNLDTMYDTKMLTIVMATPPSIVSVVPSASSVVNSLPASIIVTFNQTVTGVGLLTVNGTPLTGSSSDGGKTWSFNTTGVALPAVNGPFNCVLDTHLIVGAFGGLLFATPTYAWTFYYNPAVTATNIVLLMTDGTDTAEIAAYTTFLKSVYGPAATLSTISDNQPDGGISATPWSANVTATLNNAKLVIQDRSCDYWGYWPTGEMANSFFLTFAKPMLLTNGDAVTYRNPSWQLNTYADSGSGNSAVAYVLPPNRNSWLLRGVTIPADGGVGVYKAPYGNAWRLYYPWWYWADDVSSQARWNNPYTILAMTGDGVDRAPGRYWDSLDGVAMYWPANVQWMPNSQYTVTDAGRRGYFALGYAKEIFPADNLTVAGRQVLVNILTTMYPVPSYPVVIGVTPLAGSLLTITPPGSFSITLDRSVTGMGALSLNGNPVAAAAVGSQENRTWTWTIPANQLPNIPAILTASVNLSGVTETDSGFNLPYRGNAYGWTFQFDKNQYKPTVALVSNSDLVDSHSAYTTFLLNDAYSTSLYARSIQLEDVPGKYYNMTAATKSVLQASIDLVVVLPYQQESAINSPTQWSTLTVPVMIHKADTCIDWGMANYIGDSNPGTLNGLPAAWFLNSATAGTASLYDERLPTDPWTQGVQSQNTFGPNTVRVIPWFQTRTQTFPCLFGSYWGQPFGTARRLGMFADMWNGGTYGAYWEVGDTYWNSTVAVAKRGYLALGQSDAGTNYGQNAVANFFDPINGAVDLGAKQMLRNALRWAMNPDAKPFPLSVKSTAPPAGGSAGVLGPITVVFSKPVNGVLASDLTWNASSSGITYNNVTALPGVTVLPSGALPTDTWIFDGPWETNPALIGQYQPINITLNALDTPSHSHIVSADGDGCPFATWTWNYLWAPVPASVAPKLWTLYE